MLVHFSTPVTSVGHTPGCGEPYGSFKISEAILSQVESKYPNHLHDLVHCGYVSKLFCRKLNH